MRGQEERGLKPPALRWLSREYEFSMFNDLSLQFFRTVDFPGLLC